MARLATALSKLPSEVRAMRFRDARGLFEYWQNSPPQHELLALITRAYTSWRPIGSLPKTQLEADLQHRRSLEERWRSGAAMSPKQIVEAFGGRKVSMGAAGVMGAPLNMGGIGPFPGAH